MFIGAVRCHTALFASEPEIVNKTKVCQGHPLIGQKSSSRENRKSKNRLIMEIFHCAIFILSLICCYEILTQLEETYEH